MSAEAAEPAAGASSTGERDRALGALQGLAIGDALGMPFQLLPRDAVRAGWGAIVGGFAAPAADHPLAGGMPPGAITDDTEQALLVARLLIAGEGRIAPADLARALVAWEDDMRRRGSSDLLGPSTTRAVQAVLRGEPLETAGRTGTTNGAAMRVAPVGIATPGSDVAVLVDAVEAASAVTHATSLALAAASAVAAAVSAGVDGAGMPEALAAGVVAAERCRGRGNWIAGADVAERIRAALALVEAEGPGPGVVDAREREAAVAALLDRVALVVGTSLASQESIPAAFAVLALAPDDPWLAVRAAASLGGDADTIAAIAGAVAGAVHGTAPWSGGPAATVDAVSAARLGVNSLELPAIAEALLALRHRPTRDGAGG
ncbi:ADP-ribosylglycohydrolase family protein [Yonghaparkia sp. Root332]|uniref:ADP-ribosylglycohydrolase family protein n=1 Tax=Yonghaparkia sp. Root332 TaxID=1736516 RepID=UPI0006F79969|nr:ADP-ribosylglycohydrolase family protein [Yonghaparkia sp. Root332]KQV25504.1 ADP-ribosylglycohydrolase [Yonghaparkia sp. Root332]